jgi:hypothetical protein
MSHRSLVAVAALVGFSFLSSEALALTTQDCLDRGLCAYVSPTGRVTCGKCPGQALSRQRVLAKPFVASSPECAWRRGFFGYWRFVCPKG